jgi:hypothetical protein
MCGIKLEFNLGDKVIVYAAVLKRWDTHTPLFKHPVATVVAGSPCNNYLAIRYGDGQDEYSEWVHKNACRLIEKET